MLAFTAVGKGAPRLGRKVHTPRRRCSTGGSPARPSTCMCSLIRAINGRCALTRASPRSSTLPQQVGVVLRVLLHHVGISTQPQPQLPCCNRPRLQGPGRCTGHEAARCFAAPGLPSLGGSHAESMSARSGPTTARALLAREDAPEPNTGASLRPDAGTDGRAATACAARTAGATRPTLLVSRLWCGGAQPTVPLGSSDEHFRHPSLITCGSTLAGTNGCPNRRTRRLPGTGSPPPAPRTAADSGRSPFLCGARRAHPPVLHHHDAVGAASTAEEPAPPVGHDITQRQFVRSGCFVPIAGRCGGAASPWAHRLRRADKFMPDTGSHGASVQGEAAPPRAVQAGA